MTEIWSLEWSHGRVTVHAAGGALGRSAFRFEDGRWIEPFYEAPWLGRSRPINPPMLANLRADCICLPFGRPYGTADALPGPWATAATTPVRDEDGPTGASDALLHGFGANADWKLVSRSDAGIVIAVDYPEDSPIERLTRAVKPVSGEAAIEVAVEIHARRSCRRPIGFHPNFALRGRPGSFRIEPGRFAFGLTHPTGEAGVSRARPDTRFHDLGAVPLKDGGSARFDLLPFAGDTEEIVQLCGIDGSLRLVDDEAGASWTLTFDPSALPSCLLWMSNRGRKYDPWNGDNLCVGVEPVASAFDLGVAAALAPNPMTAASVRTAIRVEPDSPVTIGFRLAGHSLART